MTFMFELLVDGTVQMLCNKFKEKGIPYGFGGIAQIGEGTLPAENIIAEHYRLGSSMAILSRSFCNTKKYSDDIDLIEKIFNKGVREIRDYEKVLSNKQDRFFKRNQKLVKNKVLEIISTLTKK